MHVIWAYETPVITPHHPPCALADRMDEVALNFRFVGKMRLNSSLSPRL